MKKIVMMLMLVSMLLLASCEGKAYFTEKKDVPVNKYGLDRDDPSYPASAEVPPQDPSTQELPYEYYKTEENKYGLDRDTPYYPSEPEYPQPSGDPTEPQPLLPEQMPR